MMTNIPDPTEPAMPEATPMALRDEIAKAAYGFWEADGRPEGSAMHYWLAAESEVLKQHGLEHLREDTRA